MCSPSDTDRTSLGRFVVPSQYRAGHENPFLSRPRNMANTLCGNDFLDFTAHRLLDQRCPHSYNAKSEMRVLSGPISTLRQRPMRFASRRYRVVVSRSTHGDI